MVLQVVYELENHGPEMCALVLFIGGQADEAHAKTQGFMEELGALIRR